MVRHFGHCQIYDESRMSATIKIILNPLGIITEQKECRRAAGLHDAVERRTIVVLLQVAVKSLCLRIADIVSAPDMHGDGLWRAGNAGSQLLGRAVRQGRKGEIVANFRLHSGKIFLALPISEKDSRRVQALKFGPIGKMRFVHLRRTRQKPAQALPYAAKKGRREVCYAGNTLHEARKERELKGARIISPAKVASIQIQRRPAAQRQRAGRCVLKHLVAQTAAKHGCYSIGLQGF